MSNLHQDQFWPRTGICALPFLALSGCLDGAPPPAAAQQQVTTESIPGAAYTIYSAGEITDCKNLKREHSNAAKTAALVGTGSTPLTPIGFPKRNSEASYNATHGLLKLALTETGYEWEFFPVAGDRFKDRGTTLCH